MKFAYGNSNSPMDIEMINLEMHRRALLCGAFLKQILINRFDKYIRFDIIKSDYILEDAIK